MSDHFYGPDFFLHIDGKPDYLLVQDYYRRCEAESRLHVVIQIHRRRRNVDLVQCNISCSWEHLSGRQAVIAHAMPFQRELKKRMMNILERLREKTGLPFTLRPRLSFEWYDKMLTFRNIPENLADEVARETCDTIASILEELEAR